MSLKSVTAVLHLLLNTVGLYVYGDMELGQHYPGYQVPYLTNSVECLVILCGRIFFSIFFLLHVAFLLCKIVVLMYLKV